MCSALLLTSCGNPQSGTAEESSAAETATTTTGATTTAAQTTAAPQEEQLANGQSETEPVSADAADTPCDGIRFGMTIDEIHAVLGEEALHDTDVSNPLLAESYSFLSDTMKLFDTEYSVPGETLCYLDEEGCLAQITFTLGQQPNAEQSTFYASADAQNADKEQLFSYLKGKLGEPTETDDSFGDDSASFLWNTDRNLQYWLSGSAALWGIEGNTCNLLTVSLIDGSGNQVKYSDYSGPKKSSGGGSKKKSEDSLREGEYWCMGKNDTCTNKTYDPFDYYCYSCDPDNNNIEGDQRSSGGKITDRDRDGDVDEGDWEQAWKDYLKENLD